MYQKHPWELLGYNSLLEWCSLPLNDRIHMVGSLFLGGRYTAKGERSGTPFRLPDGIRVPPGKNTVCSTMTASILVSVFPHKPWSGGDWMDFQVGDAERLDSPVDAVVRRGVGERVPRFEDGRWHLVQGWRSFEPLSGHAFLVKRVGDSALVLQSSSRNRMGPTLDLVDLDVIARKYRAALYLAVLT
ncbi:MAG: hypothetical protein ACPHCN_09355 [Mycobacterium sp.]